MKKLSTSLGLIVLVLLAISCQKEPFVTSNYADLSANGTANCYIVTKPGGYCFNARYKGNGTESIGDAKSATVIWETYGTKKRINECDLVARVFYEDNGYVKFITNKKFDNGNALIAVKNDDGDILWSWHIWFCKDFDPVATAQTYDLGTGTYMDRNLGATSAKPGSVEALGLLYQWGRKDPFLNDRAVDGTWKTALSTLSFWPKFEISDEEKGTVEYTIKHPTSFIGVEPGYDIYDWYIQSDPNVTMNRWSHTKSIYDPCPAGWRVPDSSGWNKISDDIFRSEPYNGNKDEKNFGCDFALDRKVADYPSIWYPMSGYLHLSDKKGGVYYTGYEAVYWTNKKLDAQVGSAGAMHINHDGVYVSLEDCATGGAVRCQRI